MNGIPLIRASALDPYLEVLGTLGISSARPLARVHLPPAEALRPDGLIAYQQALDFAAACAEMTGIRELPVHAARHTGLHRLGTWGRLLGHSGTLGDLLRKTIETCALHTNAVRWWVEDQGPEIRFCHQFDRRLDLGDGGAVFTLLGHLLGAIRSVLGADFQPAEVTVAVPLPLPGECIGLRSRVRPTGTTSVLLPRRLLSTPTKNITSLLAEADTEERASLSRNAPAPDLVGSLRQALVPLACAGGIEIETVAEILRLSVRTLQRKLLESGISYRELMQQVQFARALQLMTDPSRKLIDVAFALGFSEHAHFTRAFRRWTGISPSAFRGIHLNRDRAAIPRAAVRTSR